MQFLLGTQRHGFGQPHDQLAAAEAPAAIGPDQFVLVADMPVELAALPVPIDDMR